MLEKLKWDPDEGVTRPTRADASAVTRDIEPLSMNDETVPRVSQDGSSDDTKPRISRPSLVDTKTRTRPTDSSDVDTRPIRRRDVEEALAAAASLPGPPTERDAIEPDQAPSTEASPQNDYLRNWEDGDPTYPQRGPVPSAVVAVESAAPGSTVSPIRGSKTLASAAVPDDRPSDPICLGMAAAIQEPLSSLFDSEPPPPESAIRRTGDRHPKSEAIPLVVDIEDFTATVRQQPSEPPQSESWSAEVQLRSEVARLRRLLAWTLTFALLALCAAVVLAAVIFFGNEPEATRAGDGGMSPALQLPADEATAGPTRTAAEPAEAPAEVKPAAPTKVEVLVALSTPNANVVLTPIGGTPRTLSGPWPKTFHLDPGKYTIAAAKGHRPPVMQMLDLSLDKPRREVVLTLR